MVYLIAACMLLLLLTYCPLSVVHIFLPVTGSRSSIYCRKLLCVMMAAPAVYPFTLPSPMKNNVCCSLVSHVLWFALVPCRPNISILSLFIPFLLHPLLQLVAPIFREALLLSAPSTISILCLSGNWTLVWFSLFCLLLSACCLPTS